MRARGLSGFALRPLFPRTGGTISAMVKFYRGLLLACSMALLGGQATAAGTSKFLFHAWAPPSISSDKKFVYFLAGGFSGQIDLETGHVNLFEPPCRDRESGLWFPVAWPGSQLVLGVAGQRRTNLKWLSVLDPRSGQVERLGTPMGTAFDWLSVNSDGTRLIYAAMEGGFAQASRLFQVDLVTKEVRSLSPFYARCQDSADCPILPVRLVRPEPSYADTRRVTFRAVTNEREDSRISRICSAEVAGSFHESVRFRGLLFELDLGTHAAGVHPLNCRAISETGEYPNDVGSGQSIGIEHHVNGDDGTLYFSLSPQRRGQKRSIHAYRQGRIEPVLRAENLMGPFSASFDGRLFAHLSSDGSALDKSGVRLRVADVGTGSERFYGLEEISRGIKRTAECRPP